MKTKDLIGNREIKFRAWNKEAKEMIDLKKITPLALDSNMNTQLAMQGGDGLFIPFLPDMILMQFTGLLDKNGVGIWEGDVIKRGLTTNDGEDFGVVIYKDGGFGLDLIKNNIGWGGIRYSKNIEVIGNIFNKPKLLTK